MVRLVSHDNLIFKTSHEYFVFTNWHGYHGNLVSIVTDMIIVPKVCTYKCDRLIFLCSSLLNIKLFYFAVTKQVG